MKHIDTVFRWCWLMIRLTLLFHLLSLCGLFLFGWGPAFHTIMAEFLETKQPGGELDFKRAFQTWKAHFKTGNLYFLTFIAVLALLSYNVYLSVQLR